MRPVVTAARVAITGALVVAALLGPTARDVVAAVAAGRSGPTGPQATVERDHDPVRAVARTSSNRTDGSARTLPAPPPGPRTGAATAALLAVWSVLVRVGGRPALEAWPARRAGRAPPVLLPT